MAKPRRPSRTMRCSPIYRSGSTASLPRLTGCSARSFRRSTPSSPRRICHRSNGSLSRRSNPALRLHPVPTAMRTMNKPAVLVTGGAGYIGSHAVLALKDAGWRVAVIDDLSNGSREVVPADVPFYQGSIAERVLLDSVIDEQQIGAIMHFAGSIVVSESVEHPLKYYANNTLASHRLISAAVDAGVKHILFSSTAAVYGAPERVPIGEDDPKLPINPYGASKLMTERMLEDAAAAHPFNYGALRYFNVAGADPQGRSGQQGKGSTHLIKVAVETAVGKREQVAVLGTESPTPDGTCI